mgnify:CR=1 FL=1
MTTFGLPMRTRKLIGLVVLLAYMFIYAMLVMTIAVYRLPENGVVEFVYFLAAGIIWAIPAKYLLRWMQMPDPGAPAA